MKRNDLNLPLVILTNLWIVLASDIEYAPLVETNKGPVVGYKGRTVKNNIEFLAYKNIRYAKPPVGHLRFRPPIEVDAWVEPGEVIKESSNCPQIMGGHVVGDEDCLNLNIYTRKLPDGNSTEELSTVMFFIYGGAYTSGENSEATYSPDYLLEDDVVVVSVNYRLGPLGFLEVRHPNATGNAGLKDQLLALKWVRENIAKFGGDPNKVTIFGQSAGGASVGLHMLSEASRGLFRAAITMSASPLTLWACFNPEEGKDNAFRLGRTLGFNGTSADELLEFFYKADVKDIIGTSLSSSPVDIPFRPTVEDTSLGPRENLFLTECPIRKYLSGDFAEVPYIIGNTKNEALIFISDGFTLITTFIYLFDRAQSLGIVPDILNVVDPVTLPSVNLSDISLYTDLLFVSPIDLTQRLLSKSKQPIYYYRFTYADNKTVHKVYGQDIEEAAHGDDLPMIFYSDYSGINPNSHDIRELVQTRMTRMWTNFAKYLNPTPDNENDNSLGNFVWRPSNADGEMLEINDKLEMRSRYTTERILRMQEVFRTAGTRINGCIKP